MVMYDLFVFDILHYTTSIDVDDESLSFKGVNRNGVRALSDYSEATLEDLQLCFASTPRYQLGGVKNFKELRTKLFDCFLCERSFVGLLLWGYRHVHDHRRRQLSL